MVTNDSISKAIHKTYGFLAYVVAVHELFIPQVGWVPSLFDCRTGDLSTYLQFCEDINVSRVNLKIIHDKPFSPAFADFVLLELEGK